MNATIYDSLHHQFLISRHPSAGVYGWDNYGCEGYFLSVHPTLPVSTVLDKDGNEVGYVLGWPIDRSGRVLQTNIRISFHLCVQTTERLEKFIYELGGRYAFLILAPDLKRLYLDAGGTLSAVYSARTEMAGSTVTVLVGHEPNHPLWSAKLGDFPDNRPNQYWPAGTTLDPTIYRLLPNHYLDLITWRAVRHYPKTLEDIHESDVGRYVDNMVSSVRRHIVAVTAHAQRVYLPLTAGRDSRVLLACSKECTERIEYVTFDYSPWRQMRGDRVDLYIAKSLAKRFGLHQQAIPVTPKLPSGTESQYLRGIGFSGGAGKSHDFFWSCRQHLDLSAAWLTGFAGEVGRTFYLRSTDKETDRMSPAELLNRMALPSSDRLQNAMDAWLRDLPELPFSTLLDFVYLEHRLGCWAAPHFYGAAPFSVNLSPFNHREVYHTMLRLPLAYRRSKALFHDIVSSAWPELLSLPYNEYPGIRGLMGPESWMGRTKRKARSVVKRMLFRSAKHSTYQN